MSAERAAEAAAETARLLLDRTWNDQTTEAESICDAVQAVAWALLALRLTVMADGKSAIAVVLPDNRGPAPKAPPVPGETEGR